MLRAYITAVNAGDYRLAYHLFLDPSFTYDQFVSGYADTRSIEGYFGSFQPDIANSYEVGRLAAILVGHRVDGSDVTYRGCYRLANSNGWRILNSDFQVIALSKKPSQKEIDKALDINCYNNKTISPAQFASAQDMLTSYYSAISSGDYATAYQLWFNPVQGYDDFSKSFQDVTNIDVYFGAWQVNPTQIADNTDEYGGYPMSLVVTRSDGSVVTYVGCHFIGHIYQYPKRWRIFNIKLQVSSLPADQNYPNAQCYDTEDSVAPQDGGIGN
jgi:hypothetical protein